MYKIITMVHSYTVAKTKFSEGYNCAQSCLYPFAIKAGMSHEHALQLPTAFGTGMMFRGEMCGAITGSMMAIGLFHGKSKISDADAKEKTYALIQELHKQFTAKHGSIICKELLSLEKCDAENWETASTKFESHCPIFVEDAARITENLLQKHNDTTP
ncbi:MAG TPA: C-GCAxxG-C-C family protein [Bacteroidales bacterium]|nr:C-GCAxxG-C-C family protein [Bacteroidales bacterium]